MISSTYVDSFIHGWRNWWTLKHWKPWVRNVNRIRRRKHRKQNKLWYKYSKLDNKEKISGKAYFYEVHVNTKKIMVPDKVRALLEGQNIGPIIYDDVFKESNI